MTYAELLERYLAKHGALLRPVSLQPSLHLAYSMAMKRSFTNLGTYNPRSTLPGGGKSDHAYYPAWAFDLGRPGWRGLWGFGYLAARRLANLYVEHAYALGIEYVIVGRRIWSRTNGWRAYNADRSHDWHVHVSGHRQ
jgi:hypothetical protein